MTIAQNNFIEMLIFDDRMPASTAGMFVGMTPVSTVILSYVLLKESFQWTHVLGILCVLAALICITADTAFYKHHSTLPHTKSPSMEGNEGRQQMKG